MFMPVIEDFNVSSKTRYVLWEITENFETLFSGIELDLNSKQLLSQKKSEIHKNQFLAVRYLLQYLSIDLHNLNYDSLGKPFFENNYKISISHHKTTSRQIWPFVAGAGFLCPGGSNRRVTSPVSYSRRGWWTTL